MPDGLELIYRSIDEEHADKPAATRRQLVAGAAATLGGLGLLGLPGVASADHLGPDQDLDVIPRQNLQLIANVATTAEVLATIVNTVGAVGADAVGGQRVGPVALPADGTLKISASASQELGHYEVLRGLGGKPATKRIWVPDAVFADAASFLGTLEVGDQIFINAYLIATTEYARAGAINVARAAAEFMGVEAVHRAFARDLRGLLGNDRMFMKFDQAERAPGAPNLGQRGFERIEGAVTQLQAAGFGFGKEGAKPGRFYDFESVRQVTPDPPDVNTREVD